MKQSKNLSADTSPLLSPVTEETLYRRSVAFPIIEDFVVPKVNPQSLTLKKCSRTGILSRAIKGFLPLLQVGL